MAGNLHLGVAVRILKARATTSRMPPRVKSKSAEQPLLREGALTRPQEFELSRDPAAADALAEPEPRVGLQFTLAFGRGSHETSSPWTVSSCRVW